MLNYVNPKYVIIKIYQYCVLYIPLIGMHIILIVVCLLPCMQTKLDCRNQGLPILTRTTTQPYQLRHQCLCPFDYFGDVCANHLSILCYFKNAKVLQNNSMKNNQTANLQFELECYLQKRVDNYIQQSNDSVIYTNAIYTTQLPMINSDALEQQQNSNYGIDQNYQIIWANDTDMFDENGQLIREDQNDTRTDAQILEEFPHYSFNYSSQFLGVPLTNSRIWYELNNVKFMSKWNRLGEIKDMEIADKFDAQGRRKGLILNYGLQINESWEELGITRLQLTMNENYGQFETYHKIAMKNVQWLLMSNKIEKGQQIATSYSIPSSVWIIAATLLAGLLILSIRAGLKFYKKWRSRRNIEFLEEESDISKV